MSEHKTLVEVQHLQQYFPAGGVGKNRKYVQAVDDVSFAIRKGETLGLVGESGCGKTTTGRTLLRLYEPTGGKIYYDGNLLFDKDNKIAGDMLPYRRRMQIVFQDPYASLDPRMTIGDIVGEGIDIHHLAENEKDRHDKIIALLERVGLNSEHANRYCHEFSGGQRQRVGIARALAVNNKIAVDMLPYRRRMQIVFQDPYASLDPRMTIGDIVGEGIDIHHLAENEKDRHDKIIALLERVGLNSEHANRYCHEFSGGQRQRVGIARALAVNPEFIVCDEPVSALDVSIQAQVVNMFEDLQQEMGLTYLFIAHDLSVVKHISNRIGVMYLGKMVELADSYELITHSIHPYTRSLISAIPVADPITARQSKRIVLQGDVPSPLNPPSGCRFRTRCPYADEQCANEVPEFKEVSTGHWAACHHLDRVK